MKKLFAVICTLVLVFTLCSCKSVNDDISGNSSVINPTSTTTDDVISSDNTTTESVGGSTSDVSDGNQSTAPTENNSSTSEKDNISSKPVVDDTPTEDEKPKEEPINFVPNASNSYSHKIFYKNAMYACASGKNNGTDCWAVVTLDENGEYLNCVYVFDSKNNERAHFNIYNDRIYYFRFAQIDSKENVLSNNFSIHSVNLSGTDKKLEKKIDISFTHILSGQPVYYLNSKYLFFDISNLLDGIYDEVYRYNIETHELIKLNFNIGAHKTIYSVGEQVFIWHYGLNTIYEYDADLKNEKLFHTVDDPHKTNSLVVSLQDNGFLLHHWNRDDKYLLDFSGNRTQIS